MRCERRTPKSFLAPSLKQLFAGQEQGAESVDCLNDPTNAICVAFGNTTSDNFPYNEISGSNPNLRPETGKTYNLGFIFEPDAGPWPSQSTSARSRRRTRSIR